MLSTRGPLQTQEHLQTQSKGMGEGIPHKRKSKDSWSSNTHIGQNRLFFFFLDKIDFKTKTQTKKDTT